MAEEIPGPKIPIEVQHKDAIKAFLETGEATKDLAKAVDAMAASIKASADKTNPAERAMDRFDKTIQRMAAELRGNGATAQLGMLEKALERAGGASNLTAVQTQNLAAKIESLRAAGGKVPESLDQITRGTDGLTSGLMRLGGMSVGLPILSALATGATAAGAAFLATGAMMIKYSDEVGTLAERTKLSTDSIQKFRYAAEQSGTSIEALTNSSTTLSKKLGEGAEKTGLAVKELGLSIDKLRNSSAEEALSTVLERVAAIENPTRRAAVGAELLGKSFSELVPLGGELRQLTARAEELGLVMSPDKIAAAKKLGDTLSTLGTIFQALSHHVGSTITSNQSLHTLVEGLVDIFAVLTGEVGKNRQVMTDWVSMGAVGVARALVTMTGAVNTALDVWDALGLTWKSLKNLGLQVVLAFEQAIAAVEKFSGDKKGLEHTKANIESLQKLIAANSEAANKTAEASTTRANALEMAKKKLEELEKRVEAVRGQEVKLAKDTDGTVPTFDGMADAMDAAKAKAKALEEAVKAARKTQAEAAEQYAAAEKMANETLHAGMSALEVKLQQIEAQKLAEIDAAHAIFKKAQAENRETEEIRRGVNARIQAANARAAGAASLEKENEAQRVSAASAGVLEKAQRAAAAARQRGEPSLQNQISMIVAERDANIRAAEVAREKGDITEEALQQAAAAYHSAANAAIAYAKAMSAAKTLGDVANVAGAVQDFAAGLGLKSDSDLSKMLSGFQQQAAGASQFVAGVASGNIAQAVIGGLKSLSGTINLGKAVVGLFSKSDQEKAAEEIGRDFGAKVSKELSQAIADFSKKEGIGRFEANLLHISEIAKESGKDLRTFGKNIGDLFNLTASSSGKLREQGVDALSRAFKGMADQAVSAGGRIDDTMRAMIARTKELGLEIPAITEFLKTQSASIADGFNKVATSFAAPIAKAGEKYPEARAEIASTRAEIEKLEKQIKEAEKNNDPLKADALREKIGLLNIKLGDLQKQLGGFDETFRAAGDTGQAAFDRINRLAAVSVEAARANGASLLEAINMAGPGLDALQEAQRVWNFEIGASARELLELRQFVSVNEELIGSLDGLNQMMVGLHNSNLLTKEAFADLAAQAAVTREQLVAQGMDGDQALRLMQPTIQGLWEMQQKYGFAVDETTQKLIDDAVAADIVGEKHRSAQDRMVEGLERVAKGIEAIASGFGFKLPEEAKRGAQGVNDALGGIRAPEVRIPITWEMGDRPDLPGVPGFKTGTEGFQDFGSGTLAMLHGSEAVVPEGGLGGFLESVDMSPLSVGAAIAGGPSASQAPRVDRELLNEFKGMSARLDSFFLMLPAQMARSVRDVMQRAV